MMIDEYVQPIAQHSAHPERLLVRGTAGRWYVWTGERAAAPPDEISPATAAWLLIQPGMRLLPPPHVWLHPADLPTVAQDARTAGIEPIHDDLTE